MKELSLKKRICESCGSDDLALVHTDKMRIKTHQETYLLKVFIVICKNCGFCFNSPCAQKEDLLEYYKDSLAVNENIFLAYSVEIRLAILKKYAGGNFVEVGGNQSGKFYDQAKKYFPTINTIEPNRECSPEAKTIGCLPENSVDVLAHYDVLEHIPDVKDFLSACHSALKNTGVMIVEVPDIKLYPKNLMLLSGEHVNHFSVNTLEKIAGQCGFSLIEVNHAASRPFSFSAVFKKEKNGQSAPAVKNRNEYLDNLACLENGLEQIEKVKIQIKDLQAKIIKMKDKKIALWCITDFLYRFLKNYDLPKNAIIIDSDPRKKDHLDVPVFLPSDCLDYIKQSDLLVIFSPRSKNNILNWIKKTTGKEYDLKKLEVIGCGVYGEPLLV